MGKNRSASGITNVIQYDNNGNITFVSGSTTLMQVSSSGAITTTGVISGSNALSASFSLNSALLNGTGSVGFATTASLLTVSSSQQQISASLLQVSASLLTLTASFNAVSSSQQQISASLLQVSASYIALSGSYNTFSGSASTRITANSSSIQQVSASQQQISSSQQQISSSLLNVISIFATTGSNSFRATQSITGSLTVTGQIIAQTLNVQQVTSSIIYSSGSNNFGCDLNSRQTFTGSVLITGSLTIAGASSATSYSGTTIYGSTIACSPIGCFATSCATAFIGGTMSGTTIYGSTAVCSAVGLFSDNVGLGATSSYAKFNISTGDDNQMALGTTSVGQTVGIYLADGPTTSSVGYKWEFGKTTANNFFIYSYCIAANALTIASTGAATFTCQVNAESFYTNDTRYISNQIMSGYNTNSEDSDIWINYTGYLGGTTRFRDFRIGNGKQGQIAVFDGSTGAATFACSVNVNGLATSANYKLGVTGAAFISGTNSKGIFITDSATYASIVGLNSAISAYNKLELRASGCDGQIMLHTNGNVSIGNTTDTGDQLYLAGNLKMVTNGKIDSNGGYLAINSVAGVSVGIGSTPANAKLLVYDTGCAVSLGISCFYNQARGIDIYNAISGTTNNVVGLWISTGPHKAGIASGRTCAETTWEVDLRFYTHPTTIGTLDGTCENMRLYGDGSLVTRGGTSTPGLYSDINLKENLLRIPSALNKIKCINGYLFDWKYNAPARSTPDLLNIIHDAGLIAQEVEEVMPDIVRNNDLSCIKMLNYNGITALLVEGMKEQQCKIALLESCLGIS